MHKALFAFAALSLTAPAGLLAQESPPAPPRPTTPAPPAPPAAPPPAARPAAAPAPTPGSAAPRIEFVSQPMIQAAPEPKTGDRPVCRGEVVDSCIQPGAARQQGR